MRYFYKKFGSKDPKGQTEAVCPFWSLYHKKTTNQPKGQSLLFFILANFYSGTNININFFRHEEIYDPHLWNRLKRKNYWSNVVTIMGKLNFITSTDFLFFTKYNTLTLQNKKYVQYLKRIGTCKQMLSLYVSLVALFLYWSHLICSREFDWFRYE